MRVHLRFLSLVFVGLTSPLLVGLESTATRANVVLPLSAATAGVQHRFFGRLESANGTGMTLRLRNGRVLSIDAAKAFALKRVSAPLFFGKPTVVEGSFVRGGIFEATVVRRAAPRPQSWGADL